MTQNTPFIFTNLKVVSQGLRALVNSGTLGSEFDDRFFLNLGGGMLMIKATQNSINSWKMFLRGK